MLALSPRTALVTILLSPLLLDPSALLARFAGPDALRIASGVRGAQAAVTVYTGAAANGSSTVAAPNAQYTGLVSWRWLAAGP